MAEKLTGDDVCAMMHTSLRKACDSKATTAVYLLIHMNSDVSGHVNPWRLLGALVAERIAEGKTPQVALRSLIEETMHEFGRPWANEWQRREDALTGNARGGRWEDYRRWIDATGAVFDLFDDNDWKGMVAYL